MKNKRILKIFLFSILIVASLVTYLSYGVKEKTTTSSLNLENNKSDFTNILMEKSIMLDVKIQRRKGDYDLFNHYVSGDIDGEINDGYSLKSAFKDFIMYLEDNNSRESRGIQYYVYDIVDETKTFQERLKILTELNKCISLSSITPNKVVVVNHESVSGKDAIIQLHNQYVSEGYEGLVIRDPNEKYKCGARDKRMLKVKMFQDDEFEITGMTNGLREEDFVFNMKTKEGYPFEAKPMGDRALKKWYRENIDKLIGQMGTVKYFGYTATENAVPNLPVFKSLRDKTVL